MTTAIIGIVTCDGCGKEERGEVDLDLDPGPRQPDGWLRFTFTDWNAELAGHTRGLLADVHSVACAKLAFTKWVDDRPEEITAAEPAVAESLCGHVERAYAGGFYGPTGRVCIRHNLHELDEGDTGHHYGEGPA